MMYLIDANVLITAHHLYYPVDAVPEFWDWIAHQGHRGVIKMPIETLEEVKDGSDDAKRDLLFAWIQDEENKNAILFKEDVKVALVQQVTNQYAADLTDNEIEAIGRDPFLIAHALADPGNRSVVTTEVSKRRLQRQNRRIPDVCADVGVQCFNTFEMLRALRFSTQWRV
jgi:hypothetical protein